MKFPYGICDFRKISRKGYFYCDRTGRIPILEKNYFQLFIRPRRFGKSLLLSMLENYYDVAKKDEFDALFGHLEIGDHDHPAGQAAWKGVRCADRIQVCDPQGGRVGWQKGS
ncbi:MAG: hypothetical protein C4B58_12395 [Deltaproteobacteria bacterium]|nr:MAG: hypothetical protein C4B58_12395 [Deltaproteobacteria bacterium]